jgi:hypothetical protein
MKKCTIAVGIHQFCNAAGTTHLVYLATMVSKTYVESNEWCVISAGVQPSGKFLSGNCVNLSSVPGVGFSWGRRSSSFSSMVSGRLLLGFDDDVSPFENLSSQDTSSSADRICPD